MKCKWIVFMMLMTPFYVDAAVFCKRGPDGAVILPEVIEQTDKCEGTAKVQSFQYSCGSIEQVEENKRRFFTNILSKAKKLCEDHCAMRARGCVGLFTEPAKCGFTVSYNQAVPVGQNIAECPSECPGNAFSYCSIYHGGYTSFDQSLYQKHEPNCVCKWKKNLNKKS